MPRGEFRNEPFTDFSNPTHKAAFQAALEHVRAQLGGQHDLFIGGRSVAGEKAFASFNPARKHEVIGHVAKAGAAQVDSAIEAARAAFAEWKHVPAVQRSDFLFRGADELRRRKHEFSAWMVFETGKSWAEADGDTAEAIDFLDFYARENLRYASRQPLTAVPGEKNELVYLPLGVGVVIPPWNFPLAIMAGMTTAALVTGNTVVLKPSSDAPVVAARFVDLMTQLGLPKGVLNFLPGSGGEVGDRLVTHPSTRFVAFTGSKAVGLRINELAATTRPGQKWIKRVIAEMGGKDAIIVDKSADLDAAAQSVVGSAFGFQGQKCSACSRVIVDAAVYDALLDKLKTRTEKLTLGPTENPDNYMGPVINAQALAKIQEYANLGRKEGRVVVEGGPGPDHGHFLKPMIIADVAPDARLAQEEVFGPVLAVIKARDLDDALRIANGTEFGLTGSIYARDADAIARARKEFFVGNLYANRKCTGALVGGHPFGGFNMSGTDSKAGGRDYLLLFLQAQSFSQTVGT